MPTTFGFPSSARRAMKQQILLEPTSTAAIRPFLVTIRGFFIGNPLPSYSRGPCSSRVSCASPVSSLVALGRHRQIDRRLRMALPHHDAVRLPQVDDADVLIQQVVLTIEVGEVAPGFERAILRQLYIDVVVHADVPASLAHQHGGGHMGP